MQLEDIFLGRKGRIGMNPVAMITGAARNTGLAIARRFARDGYDVCLTSRSEESAAAAAEAVAREYPGVRTLGFAMEQSDLAQVEAAFRRVRDAFGRLNVFIANAAELAVGFSIYNTTPEVWDRVMDTNVRGTFFCCQAAYPLMSEGGSILLISSVHANQSIVGRVAYSASKAALGGMMRSLALELANRDIRVNAIVAGAIWTDRWAAQTPEQTAQRRLKYPAGRESTPEEIASAAAFLASLDNGTITGTELTVDSGISICLLPYEKEWNRHA